MLNAGQFTALWYTLIWLYFHKVVYHTGLIMRHLWLFLVIFVSHSSFAESFEQTYSFQGITFKVSSLNNSSINELFIKPSGLTVKNEVIKKEIDGTVSGAEIADINNDGSPEIYIYVNSAGSGSYGSLVAYSANNQKSLTEIYLPHLMNDKTNSRGYMGHDAFAIVENNLVRRFPIYKDGDLNSKPTGGTRQLQYKLRAGEAGWIMELDKVVEF